VANNFNKYILSIVDNIIEENIVNNENLNSETTDPLKYLHGAFTQPCTDIKLKQTTTKEIDEIVKLLKTEEFTWIL
jgi:hypothetical protein